MFSSQSQEKSSMSLLFFLLLLKHAIADLCLQGYIKGPSKKYYFSRKLIIHSLHHGIGTFIVLIPFVNQIEFAFLLGFLDMFLHWQIDYCKTQCVTKFNVNSNSRGFWWIQGIDQSAHYSCYFLIVFLLGCVAI